MLALVQQLLWPMAGDGVGYSAVYLLYLTCFGMLFY
jgi:hypothetical protein